MNLTSLLAHNHLTMKSGLPTSAISDENMVTGYNILLVLDAKNSNVYLTKQLINTGTKSTTYQLQIGMLGRS